MDKNPSSISMNSMIIPESRVEEKINRTSNDSIHKLQLNEHHLLPESDEEDFKPPLVTPTERIRSFNYKTPGSRTPSTGSRTPSMLNSYFYPENQNERTNLIINYLPVQMSKEDFVQLFVEIGPIDSVRLIKNPDGTHKGYGFVKFSKHEDALKAIRKYNGLILQGKKLKAAFARPGGSRSNCNLFISNLPYHWQTEDLRREFSEFGEVLEGRVLESQLGSRRCGFVRFDKHMCAKKAMECRNGYIPQDSRFPLKVTFASKGPMRKSPPKVYNPDGTIEQKSLSTSRSFEETIFNGYYMPPTKYYGSQTHLQEPSTYNTLHEKAHDIPNARGQWRKQKPRYPLQARYSDPQTLAPVSTPNKEFPPGYNSNTVYLANLPAFFTDDTIVNMCSQYGEVTNVESQKDTSGSFLGLAAVQFEDCQSAKDAAQALHGSTIFMKRITAIN